MEDVPNWEAFLYPITWSPLTLRYSRHVFTRIFRSYGREWRWKLSQLCLVRSIPWKVTRIECHHLIFYIRRIGRCFAYIQSFRFSSKSQSFSYNHSFVFSAIRPLCNMFETRTGVKELHPPQRRRVLPRLKVAWFGQGRHRFKKIFRLDKGGNGISPSFSQNLKQVLVAPDSWCIRSKVFRHQRRLLYRRRGYVKAHQLPAPCTFSSTVLASSWVPCTFSSAPLARSRALYAFSSTVQAPRWVLWLPEL